MQAVNAPISAMPSMMIDHSTRFRFLVRPQLLTRVYPLPLGLPDGHIFYFRGSWGMLGT